MLAKINVEWTQDKFKILSKTYRTPYLDLPEIKSDPAVEFVNMQSKIVAIALRNTNAKCQSKSDQTLEMWSKI